ncbi:hypothetical protein XH89_33810 [Bradyrhizobium sp. CCBAU 53340]|nr:hypothetical protein XH89_33810 [Bradyrhizobium sp. CCBAU 53340]
MCSLAPLAGATSFARAERSGVMGVVRVGRADRPRSPSLRAQRSNPDCLRGGCLDCFVARAPRNDGVGASRPLPTSRKR